MTILDTRNARAQWRDVVDQAVAGEETIVTRSGKAVAVVISYDDYELIQEQLEDARSVRLANRLLDDLDAGRITATPLADVLERLAERDRVQDNDPTGS